MTSTQLYYDSIDDDVNVNIDTNVNFNLHMYYFYYTRDTVCAPTAAVAAAYYASYIDSPSFTYHAPCRRTDQAGVAGYAIYSSFTTVICEEDFTNGILVDGLIQPHVGGHWVPNAEFAKLLQLAVIDTEYSKCCGEITDLYEDIILPLDQDIPYLTNDQLTFLAQRIMFRRDNGDILPSLRFLKEHHNAIYTEHMAAIICQKHQAVHDQA